jgi:hypothetical protein
VTEIDQHQNGSQAECRDRQAFVVDESRAVYCLFHYADYRMTTLWKGWKNLIEGNSALRPVAVVFRWRVGGCQ